MRIIIDGPQFAEAIQAAEWVVEAPDIQLAIDRLGAVLECVACQAERTAGLLRELLNTANQNQCSGLERP